MSQTSEEQKSLTWFLFNPPRILSYGNQSLEVDSTKRDGYNGSLSKSNTCISPPTSWSITEELLKYAAFEETAAQDFAASKSHFNSIMIFPALWDKEDRQRD